MTLGPRMTISPVAPAGTVLPLVSTTRTSGPAAGPTVPGFRGFGGRLLLAIWCAASVMPYASITGMANSVSSWLMTVTGSDDDDERMKRRRCVLIASALLAARRRIAWCMVGTPEYHVGCTSVIHEKNLSALKPGEQHTSPPTD